MAAKDHIRFFAGYQKKILIRLCPASLVIFVQFAGPQFSHIGRVTVAVEIHNHGRVHADRLQSRFERRLPSRPVGNRLHGEGEVPVGRKGDVTIQVRETVVVRIGLQF